MYSLLVVGVVGCAILRELARFDAAVALLERNPDICEGTSKSNSAIVHTGFDTPPGLLEARLLVEARELWPNVIDNLHIPYLQTGALMVATSLFLTCSSCSSKGSSAKVVPGF